MERREIRLDVKVRSMREHRRVWYIVVIGVCDTGSRGRTAPATAKRALGIVHNPLGIHFASGGFFPPSLRKEVFLCQAARIA
jgi:hypothetical protein